MNIRVGEGGREVIHEVSEGVVKGEIREGGREVVDWHDVRSDVELKEGRREEGMKSITCREMENRLSLVRDGGRWSTGRSK